MGSKYYNCKARLVGLGPYSPSRELLMIVLEKKNLWSISRRGWGNDQTCPLGRAFSLWHVAGARS